MSLKSIPYEGETSIPTYPAPLKCARVTVGPTTENDVICTSQATWDIFDLPAGILVHNLRTRVLAAFTSDVTVTLGDSDGAAAYLTSANIAPQTKPTNGVGKNTNIDSTGAYKNGKMYDAAQKIQLVVGAVDPIVGSLEVFLTYSMSLAD
jgi:hypothetical protein